jgi:hypothetical protein
MAFKVATIENGTTMQDAIVAFITAYAGPVLKRMKRKECPAPDFNGRSGFR